VANVVKESLAAIDERLVTNVSKPKGATSVFTPMVQHPKQTPTPPAFVQMLLPPLFTKNMAPQSPRRAVLVTV
jgi:hypothetical protein